MTKIIRVIGIGVLLFTLSIFGLRTIFPLKFSPLVDKYASEYHLDKNEVYAVIWTESKFKPQAVSRVGASGLMQLMPKTGEWCASVVGENIEKDYLFQPQVNIRLGCFYLNYLYDKFYESDHVYAAYNAGENMVRQWLDEGKPVAYPETRDYVKRVNLSKKIYAFLSVFKGTVSRTLFSR